MKGKKLIALISCLLIIIGITPFAYAADLGTISYWYETNNDYVDYIKRSSLNGGTYCYWTVDNVNGGLTYQQIVNSAATNASSAWNNQLGFSLARYDAGAIVTVVAADTAGMDQVCPGALWHINATTAGVTIPLDEAEFSHTVTWSGQTKSVLSMSGSFVFSFQTSYTQSQHNNIVAHEFGHSMGWMGHYSNTLCLMQPTVSTITTPQSPDINQVKQIYQKTLSRSE